MSTTSGGVLRIANVSGFYGDRLSAMSEMLAGDPVDVITGDYLAELTMLILGRDRAKDPALGYAKTFLKQLRDCLAEISTRGITVVTNAGGVNPRGLVQAIRQLADELGVTVAVGYVEGDDLLPRAGELGLGNPLAANAYLGGWGIASCLRAGAQIVVTGRVTDASLVLGAGAAHFDWERDNWNALAGAVVAGHIIECGTQVTGGNYAFFTEIADLHHIGFPIAELAADGSTVITKQPGTGGAVSVGTVTAQLLYEITGARYPNADVTARLDALQLQQEGPDRVAVSGAVGEPPSPTLKVGRNILGGYRNEITFVLTGLQIEAKADLVRSQLSSAIPADAQWTLARTDHTDAASEETASAMLHCVVRGSDPKAVGRAFSNAGIELVLASYPGFHVTSPPTEASVYGVFDPAYVDQHAVRQVAVHPDASEHAVPAPPSFLALEPVPQPQLPELLEASARQRTALGQVAGARSGDKGGSANIGVWVRTETAWRWLCHELTVEKFQQLLPEAASLTVHRHVLPTLWALNFVVEDILGDGVASNARFDPQAKALGEWLRSRQLDIPEILL